MEFWSNVVTSEADGVFSITPLLRYSNACSFLLIPFQDDTVHDAADLNQLLLIVHHLGPCQPGNRVVFAQENGLFRADLFAHSAENAANHVDIELAWILFDLAKPVFRRNFAGFDLDCTRRTNEFA